MYILAAIAEQCGIDYLLYEGDSYESYDEDDDLNEQKSLEVLGKIKQDSSDRLKFKDLQPLSNYETICTRRSIRNG